MKKLVFTLMMALPLALIAQPPRNANHEKMNPKQIAELKAKGIRLQLDLTEAQEKKINKALLNHIEEIKAHREKAQSERMTVYSRKLHYMEAQLKLQEQMKSILSKEQFEAWKKIAGKKGRMAMQHGKNRRGKRPSMEH